MSLDLRLIRHATALAEHGSFSRAADALGIAQPTLSRSIKDLEASVGLPLFSRHRLGVTPTDFGYLFLQQAAAVSAQVSDLEREVALAKGLRTGELAVGLGPYAAEVLLPRALPRFVAAHPAVRVRIQVDSLEVLGRALRQRSLDLVVGEGSILEADGSIEVVEPFEPIDGFLFARTGHPLDGTSVSLGDVLRYPLVQVSRLPPRVLRPFLEALAASPTAGPPRPVPAIDCPTVGIALDVVLGSDAVMLASLGSMQRELARGRVVPLLHEGWMRSNWALMRLRRRTPGPAEAAFVVLLRAAHAAAAVEEARLVQRWHARRRPHAAAGGATRRGRRSAAQR